MGDLLSDFASEPRFQVTVDGTIIEVLDGTKYQVRAKDLQTLLREKAVDIPTVSKSVLDERSKSDAFAKAITVVQVLRFLVEMIGHIASSLPLTPLKISILAFISCAAATEFFWWNKPLDLRSVTVIPTAEEKTRDFLRVFDDIDFSLPEQELAERDEPKKFFGRIVGSKEMRVLGIHLVWIGVMFNAIHFGAWKFSFPTSAKLWFWRLCCIVCCGSLFLVLPDLICS